MESHGIIQMYLILLKKSIQMPENGKDLENSLSRATEVLHDKSKWEKKDFLTTTEIILNEEVTPFCTGINREEWLS